MYLEFKVFKEDGGEGTLFYSLNEDHNDGLSFKEPALIRVAACFLPSADGKSLEDFEELKKQSFEFKQQLIKEGKELIEQRLEFKSKPIIIQRGL